MIHKIIGQLKLQKKAGEVMLQVSEFSITNSSPNQILVTSQTTHSEIRSLPVPCTPYAEEGCYHPVPYPRHWQNNHWDL